MKILQLCKKFPYPLHDGEAIAITNLSKSLVDSGCEVDLLAMNTARHFVDVNDVRDKLNHYRTIRAVEVDNRIKAKDALSNLIKGNSYHISRFESDEFRDTLIELLNKDKYDVVQLETLYLTPYIEVIRKFSKGVISMRAHNVEHEIWERIAKNTKLLPKRWYLKRLTKQLRDYEIKHLNDFDFLIAISDCDLDKFKNLGYHNGAMSSPIGLDINKYNLRKIDHSLARTISFIGSLDWMPNLEGLEWFLKKVMPKLNDVQLHIAGRNTPQHVQDMNSKNVVVHGEIIDAHHFITTHNLMVVPLLSGSGMRVKILEGMALGKLVITTSKGVEGIGATDGENILIANTPEDFAQKIMYSLDDKDLAEQIGQNARAFIKKEYDSVEIAKKLKVAYQYVLASVH